MKYVPSIAFDEMSGSAKGVTAAKSRGRKYIRNRGYGGSVRTTAQAAVKSIFKQLTQNWKNLTNAQILAWNALAQSQAGKSVLGTASKISGANLYTRLNYWIVKCGGDAVATPPTLVGVDAPAEAEFDLSAEAFTFQLTGMPDSTDNLKLVIIHGKTVDGPSGDFLTISRQYPGNIMTTSQQLSSTSQQQRIIPKDYYICKL